MKKLLITGFQPFDGESVNPALEVAKGLQGKTINGYEVIAREIPVVRFEALKAVQATIEELRPDAVITIGQAGGRPDITVERVGINIDDFRIPDNKGNQPIDEPVVAGGPVAYWATLPTLPSTAISTPQATLPASAHWPSTVTTIRRKRCVTTCSTACCTTSPRKAKRPSPPASSISPICRNKWRCAAAKTRKSPPCRSIPCSKGLKR